MTRRGRVAALVGLAIALAAGAWFLLRRGDGGPSEGVGGEHPSEDPFEWGPGLATPARDGGAGHAAPASAPEANPAAPGPALPPRVAADLRVSVVDAETGAPIPMARATVGSLTRTESKDGTYVFERRASGPVRMWGSAVGYLPSDPVEVAADDAGPVRVPLRRGLDLGGAVVCEDGTPFPHPAVWIDGEARTKVEARANRDGTFRFDAVPPGTHRVVAAARRGARAGARLAAQDVAAGTLDARVVVPHAALREANLLVVRVTDLDGKPVGRAALELAVGRRGGASTRGPGPTFLLQTTPETDPWLAVGDARDAGGRPLPLGPALVDLRRGTYRADVRLGPERTIAGTVVDEKGVGVPGIPVTAALVAPEPGKGWEALAEVVVPAPMERVVTPADGSFRVGGLGDHEYEVLAHPGSDALVEPGPTVRGGAQGVVLRLRRTRTATVTVLDPLGSPLPGAFADARAPGAGEIESDPADAEGRVRVVGLDPAKTYDLHAWAGKPEYLPATLSGWRGEDVTLRLRTALSIEGTVVDEDGRPPGDFFVHARDSKQEYVASVDVAGRFRLLPLEEGEYRLSVGLLDGGSHFGEDRALERSVRAGATDVRFVVRVGPAIEVSVAPAPRRGEALLVFREGDKNEIRSVPIPADGTLRVRRLDADTPYTLWSPPNDDGYLLVRGVRAPATVTLRRERGASLRVRVSGEALDGHVGVFARQGAIDVLGKALPDGTFEIADLPAGRWTVTATARSPQARLSAKPRIATAEAEPGSTVDLLITPAAK